MDNVAYYCSACLIIFVRKYFFMLKKISNPWVGIQGYNCFGCCPDNEFGLHLQFYEDGDFVVSHFKTDIHYQSWINTLHGGIQATLLDEISGWAVSRKLQTTGYTVKMEVRYRKQLSTSGEQLTLRAHIAGVRHSMATVEAEIINGDDEVCTSATVVYMVATPEKAAQMGFKGCPLEDE